MDILKTLDTLNAAFGPSGCEEEVAAAIAKLAKPYCDEITTDVMGNLICHKKGPGKKIMFAAHMDSLGLMVTHIEKEGQLRVGKIGWIPPGSFIPILEDANLIYKVDLHMVESFHQLIY